MSSLGPYSGLPYSSQPGAGPTPPPAATQLPLPVRIPLSLLTLDDTPELVPGVRRGPAVVPPTIFPPPLPRPAPGLVVALQLASIPEIDREQLWPPYNLAQRRRQLWTPYPNIRASKLLKYAVTATGAASVAKVLQYAIGFDGMAMLCRPPAALRNLLLTEADYLHENTPLNIVQLRARNRTSPWTLNLSKNIAHAVIGVAPDGQVSKLLEYVVTGPPFTISKAVDYVVTGPPFTVAKALDYTVTAPPVPSVAKMLSYIVAMKPPYAPSRLIVLS